MAELIKSSALFWLFLFCSSLSFEFLSSFQVILFSNGYFYAICNRL